MVAVGRKGTGLITCGTKERERVVRHGQKHKTQRKGGINANRERESKIYIHRYRMRITNTGQK